MVKDTGWAHSADQRTGHYLDAGDPVCGYDPRVGFPDEMDLRTEEPPDACRDCERIVKDAGGKPPHDHVWSDTTTFGRRHRVCRCGAQT